MTQDLTPIHIVVASDNHYAILIAPLIKSIEDNHKTPEKIEFYIIDDGISSKNKQRLEATANPATTTLHWRKAREIVPAGVKIPVDHTAFPFTTYMRLFAPYILPETVDRLIYMDVDMIVLGEISKLWNSDLKGKLFGAVLDHQKVVSCSWGGIPNYKELGIPPETKYHNSGLMVIDRKKWIAQNVAVRVIEFMNHNMKSVNYADQYGINGLLYNQWEELDARWNCAAAYDHEDPYLIHFLDIKPIFKSYNSKKKYQELFYKYLRETPWKNFTPHSHYRRVIRKVYNKLKKIKLKM